MITREKLYTLVKSPLFYILLGSALLFLLGIDWGLPNKDTWQSDSLAPFYPLLALSKGFSGGYFHKYPLVHQFILAILYLPVVIVSFINSNPLEGLQILEFLALLRSPAYATALIVIARLVSVAMGVIMIYFIYLSGKELFNKKAGLFAALIVALNPVVNQNAHVAKVDLPFLFWAVLSLYFLIKAIKYDDNKDYIKSALFACFSFGTKDQGYAIFILPFIIFLIVIPILKRHTSVIKTIFRKKFLVFSGAFIAGTLLVENVLFNSKGLAKRFALLTGDNGQRSIGYTLDIPGFVKLFLDSTSELMFTAMGVPLFLLSVAGLILLIYNLRKNKYELIHKLIFFIASLSFYIFFVQIIRQNNVRFALPQSVFLAVYGGYAIAFILDNVRKYKKLVTTTLIIVFVYTFYLAISINMNYLLDNRYTAEKWMNKNIPAGSVIEYYSYLHYLPRMPENTISYRVRKNVLAIEERKPDYIVLSSNYYTRYKIKLKQLSSGQKAKMKSLRFTTSSFPLFFYRLFSNKLSYRLVYKYENKLKFFKKIKFSKVSPKHILVFKRVALAENRHIFINKQQAKNILSEYAQKKMQANLATVHGNGLHRWNNPDFIAVAFHNKNADNALLDFDKKRIDELELYSFQYTNRINKQNLKQVFFQALATTSWAHKGYLVTADIDLAGTAYYELRSLSVRFGVGIIILNRHSPKSSDVILPAKKRKQVAWEPLELLKNKNKSVASFFKIMRDDIKNRRVSTKKYNQL